MYRSLLALFALGALSACSPGAGELCADAAAHVRECTGALPDGFAEQCGERDAAEILSLSCTELESGPGGDRADRAGWKAKGDGCFWNWQCNSDHNLTCRPAGNGVELCLLPATYGDECRDHGDCAESLQCVPDDVFGKRCRQPLQ